MSRRAWFKLLLAAALAVSTMAVVVTAAGAQEGRDGASEQGAVVEAPDRGGIFEEGDWDGDGPAPRDQQILDDLIVDGSICVGLDCVNGESFGFDTLRLKENNLRIKFQDTSTSASFPSNDWQITANDSSNGGANKFSIDDIDGGKTPFTVEAGARTNALFVEADGDIGIGTNNPVVDVHVVTGNTPTLRLEQDGSSGFTPQTWDVAGNEANFFIRDATNGSTLPFQLKPGAPTASIFIAATGDVGLGTSSPADDLHIRDTAGRARLRFDDTAAGTPSEWELGTANNGRFAFNFDTAGANTNVLTIDSAGNAYFAGEVYNNGQTITPLDDFITGEIDALRAENAALRGELDALKVLVDSLAAAQN